MVKVINFNYNVPLEDPLQCHTFLRTFFRPTKLKPWAIVHDFRPDTDFGKNDFIRKGIPRGAETCKFHLHSTFQRGVMSEGKPACTSWNCRGMVKVVITVETLNTRNSPPLLKVKQAPLHFWWHIIIVSSEFI